MWSLSVHPNCYEKNKKIFSPSIKMSGKNVNLKKKKKN